jgi:hypothetical protein
MQATRIGDWKPSITIAKGVSAVPPRPRCEREKTDVAAENPQVVAAAREIFRTARTDNPDYPIGKGLTHR